MTTMNGYIKLHRKLIEWGWYSDANTKALFLHLLLTANYRPREYRGVQLNPGDTVVGFKALSEQLGMTVNQVRTAMRHLEETGEITRKSTNKFSVVTIAKWEDYQLEEVESTNKSQTNHKQTTTPKEGKKERNIYTPSGRFVAEPPKYPRFEKEEPVQSAEMPEYMRKKYKLDKENEDEQG